MATLPTGSRVAIVGAGLIGLSTAFYLRRAGYGVVVIERDQVGSGASRGNAGEITPLTAVPLAGPGMVPEVFRGMVGRSGPLTLSPLRAARLMTFGFGFIRSSRPARTDAGVMAMTQLGAGALAAFDEMGEAGADLSGGGEGFLYTSANPNTVRDFHDLLCTRAEDTGLPAPGDLVEGSAVHELEPSLSPACAAAFIDHGARWIDPSRFVDSLGGVLRDMGVEIREGVRVTSINPDIRPSLDLVHQGRREVMRPDHVVLAAGAWSHDLMREAGIHIGVVPGKGYSFTVGADRLPEHLIHLSDARTVLVPMSGRLRVVGAMEIDGTYEVFHPDRIAMIRRVTAPLVQGIDWSDISEQWVGARPMTADGLPIIGQHRKLPGLTLATGHNMHGLSLGPVTGKAVADILLGQPTILAGKQVDMEKFSPHRLRRLLT